MEHVKAWQFRWPGHIKDVGAIRTQFHHVIDIVPTILEAAGIQAPDTVNGIKQKPIEGVSMLYTFDAANATAASKRDTQYFEMVGNRAIYHDGWVAATTPPAPSGTGWHDACLGDYHWQASTSPRTIAVQLPRYINAGTTEGTSAPS